ncbi:MAG: MarR family transcriptional regulator [Proteobacteria bacterium]|nr:MarR family transcriptional regulator [Pseudomonadota bacterium]
MSDPDLPETLDAETRLAHQPRDARPELRLWLRLLTCTTMIEREIRRRLADRFQITLPRFDLLAQLDKSPEGMTLGEISRRMMVTNGNVTGLVARIAEQGYVERRRDEKDGRVQRIAMTEKGHEDFVRMAREHGAWVRELLGDLEPGEREVLMSLLARTKASVARASAPRVEAAE